MARLNEKPCDKENLLLPAEAKSLPETFAREGHKNLL